MKKSLLLGLSLSVCALILFSPWRHPLRVTEPVLAQHPPTLVASAGQWYTPPGIPAPGCAAQPNPDPDPDIRFQPGTLSLDRFRSALQPVSWPQYTPDWVKTYQPPEQVALAHPTNFGERFLLDAQGRSAARPPLIVLHETVVSGWQTVRFFQTAHYNDADQASYHALIKRDGSIFYLVPPDKRAFGAGNSVFNSPNGPETTQTNPKFSASVNNFAYHISFETPPDGNHNGRTHSGYTDRQYASLAWLIAKTGVSDDRITTHQAVDRSGSRLDPRSFDRRKFALYLQQFPKTNEISIGCWQP
ncbi:peptidoglycan recognition protein family protein [Lyngbya confervoides]|uniref:N-acetylmuramoyl-L-alanine amidase n=1 Tax=Lyngbya confervoides BDU141951 TaxID=1574623 RepID=A0ABD4T7U8_9CYAN|nr:peptidoglycan recognition family protein [Lyngbya confervoides]MCM1984798.1 peptidoglycan recognition protein family protein [Lyngbya confervoides BDU141951]